MTGIDPWSPARHLDTPRTLAYTVGMTSTVHGPERQFADYCPPHRTTDAEYAQWVANVVSTFVDTSDGYLVADIENRRAWRREAAIWSRFLHSTAGAA